MQLGCPCQVLKLCKRVPNQTPVGLILAAVEEAGLEIADLSTVETDLEDVFLQLTRRPAGTAA